MQEALEITSRSVVYLSWLQPITNMGASGEGAEITTVLRRSRLCYLAFNTLNHRRDAKV